MSKLTEENTNFLEYCTTSRRLSINTIRVYQFDLQHFNRFLDQSEPLIIDYNELTKATLENYLITLQHYSVKTIKRKFACIRSLFRYLEYKDLLIQNPFWRFRLNIREPYKVRTAMSLDEIRLLLAVVYENKPEVVPDFTEIFQQSPLKITSEAFLWIRDIAILELLFVGGLRVSELCNLSFSASI